MTRAQGEATATEEPAATICDAVQTKASDNGLVARPDLSNPWTVKLTVRKIAALARTRMKIRSRSRLCSGLRPNRSFSSSNTMLAPREKYIIAEAAVRSNRLDAGSERAGRSRVVLYPNVPASGAKRRGPRPGPSAGTLLAAWLPRPYLWWGGRCPT